MIRQILEAVDKHKLPKIGEPKHDHFLQEWPDDHEELGGETGYWDLYYWPQGHVKGTGSPGNEDKTFVLWSLDVDPKYEGKGYGRAILKWFRDRFKFIHVVNIVEAHDFWNKMLKEGLVDRLDTDYQTDSFWLYFFDEG